MKTNPNNLSYSQLISMGTKVALFGFIMSGPVAFLIVNLVHPQPNWVSPAVFVANYHVIQNLPYYFGFFLVAGLFMIAAGLYLNYSGADDIIRFRLLLSFGLTAVFGALVSFNYICQSTFVHNLASEYRPEYDSAVSIFSLSNPLSLCWAIEMWGYGLLGIATWLMAAYYKGRNSLIQMLLVINGAVSLAGAIWISVDVSWVLSTVGLTAYLGWNILMIVALVLINSDSKKSEKAFRNG